MLFTKLIETEKGEMIMKYQNLLDRFITYVKVNTRSDENSTTTPSTHHKLILHKRLDP